MDQKRTLSKSSSYENQFGLRHKQNGIYSNHGQNVPMRDNQRTTREAAVVSMMAPRASQDRKYFNVVSHAGGGGTSRQNVT